MSGVLCGNKIVTFGGVLSGKGCNSVHFLELGKYTSRKVINISNKGSLVVEVNCCAMQSLWNGARSVPSVQALSQGSSNFCNCVRLQCVHVIESE